MNKHHAHLSRRLTRSRAGVSISRTSGPIAIKFYLKHHLGAIKATLVFGADQIRTLVSMATDSSHRVKRCHRVFSSIFDWILLIRI